MAPLWDYGCHIWYRRPELSTCHTLILPYLWYLRAHSWVMDPLGAVSRDGYLAITVRGPAHCLM